MTDQGRLLPPAVVFDRLVNELLQAREVVQALKARRFQAQLAAHQEDMARVRAASEGMLRFIVDEHQQLVGEIEQGQLNGEDLSKIRHDLRGQVGSIKGYAELIIEELRGSDAYAPDECEVLLAQVIEHAHRMLPVIDRLRLDEVSVSSDISGVYVATWSQEEAEDTNQHQGRKVLLIDDSAEKREMMARRLKRAGLDVREAREGETGLQGAPGVDLIICDVMMPGMDGYEVLGRLKRDDKTRDIPVLMVSALDEIDAAVRCIEAGAEDFLAVPINPTILYARVRASLDKKLLRDREREQEIAIAEARQELDAALESMDDGLAIFDAKRRLRRCNRAFRELYPAVEELGGSGFTISALLRACWEKGHFFSERRKRAVGARDGYYDWFQLRLARYMAAEPHVERLADGRVIEVTHNPMPSGGMVAVHKDVTVRQKREERLAYLSNHDQLTGLPNRAYFDMRLSSAVDAGQSFSLMYLDLDGFKAVNDRCGHSVGDKLLIAVGAALRDSVRVDDVVARLGGDEFAVLLEGAPRHVAGLLAVRILDTVGKSFVPQTADGEELTFGASIGVALFPEDGADLTSVLDSADTAMYAAKAAGKGCVRFADEVGADDAGSPEDGAPAAG